MHSAHPVYEARSMSLYQPRSWVLLAVLSLLLELWQGGSPMGLWWESASIAQSPRNSTRSDARTGAQGRTNRTGAGPEEEEDESDDQETREEEDPASSPESDDESEQERGEDAEEEDDDDPAKRSAPLVSLMAHSADCFLHHRGNHNAGFYVAEKLFDLTHREAPERPPRTI